MSLTRLRENEVVHAKKAALAGAVVVSAMFGASAPAAHAADLTNCSSLAAPQNSAVWDRTNGHLTHVVHRSDNRDQLVTADVNLNHPRVVKLFPAGYKVEAAGVSRDGSRVLLDWSNDNGQTLNTWLYDRAAHTLRSVTNHASSTLSGDGRFFVSYDQSTNEQTIDSWDSDSTCSLGTDDRDPYAWSGDGTQLYTDDYSAGGSDPSVYRFDPRADINGRANLTNSVIPSPYGSLGFYTVEDGSYCAFYRSTATGASATVFRRACATDVTFSPSGKYILTSLAPHTLSRLTTDGKSETVLTRAYQGEDVFWSNGPA